MTDKDLKLKGGKVLSKTFLIQKTNELLNIFREIEDAEYDEYAGLQEIFQNIIIDLNLLSKRIEVQKDVFTLLSKNIYTPEDETIYSRESLERLNEIDRQYLEKIEDLTRVNNLYNDFLGEALSEMPRVNQRFLDRSEKESEERRKQRETAREYDDY